MPRIAWARAETRAPASASTAWAVRERVADRRVAGDRLHVRQRPLRRPPDERALDAAVLVSERDLEVEDLLAVALEPEVPGLDHAGVDRADRDLVHLVSLDPEEVRHARRDRGVRRPAPGVVARTIRVVVTHRLQPGMPLEPHAELLGDLALEEMRLRDLGDEGRERRSVAVRARDGKAPVRVVREHGDEGDTLGCRPARGSAAAPKYDTRRFPLSRTPLTSHPRKWEGSREGTSFSARARPLRSTTPAVTRRPPASSRRRGPGRRPRPGSRCP